MKLLWASGHIFINQSIRHFVLYVFLFKDSLCDIDCWFINIEFMANSTITDAWMKPIKHFLELFSP